MDKSFFASMNFTKTGSYPFTLFVPRYSENSLSTSANVRPL